MGVIISRYLDSRSSEGALIRFAVDSARLVHTMCTADAHFPELTPWNVIDFNADDLIRALVALPYSPWSSSHVHWFRLPASSSSSVLSTTSTLASSSSLLSTTSTLSSSSSLPFLTSALRTEENNTGVSNEEDHDIGSRMLYPAFPVEFDDCCSASRNTLSATHNSLTLMSSPPPSILSSSSSSSLSSLSSASSPSSSSLRHSVSPLLPAHTASVNDVAHAHVMSGSSHTSSDEASQWLLQHTM